MARKTDRNFVSAKTSAELALSTLAVNTVLATDLVAQEDDLFYISMLVKNMSLAGRTAGEGPIIWGVADGDYTVAEIKECIDARGIEGFDQNDRIELEQARRAVREIGAFSGEGTAELWNDGQPTKVKLGFTVNRKAADGSQNHLQVWFMNQSSATLTTGIISRLDCVLYARKKI